MTSKFEQVLEEQLNRFTRNGLLTGDLVKFKENFLNDEWTKTQEQIKVDLMKELSEQGDYLRVGHIKSPYGYSLAGKTYEPDNFFVDVTREIAPGIFTDVVTVPAYLVELQMMGGENRTQTPINPKNVRPNNEIIKPEAAEKVVSTARYIDDKHPTYPVINPAKGNEDPGNREQADKYNENIPDNENPSKDVENEYAKKTAAKSTEKMYLKGLK